MFFKYVVFFLYNYLKKKYTAFMVNMLSKLSIATLNKEILYKLCLLTLFTDTKLNRIKMKNT